MSDVILLNYPDPDVKAIEMINEHFTSISFEMEDCSFTYRPDEFIIQKTKAAKKCSLITLDYLVKQISLLPVSDVMKHVEVEYWEAVRSKIN